MCKGPNQRTASTTETETIPGLATAWRNAYLTIPKANFPCTNLSISFSLVSAAFLISVRLLATRVLEDVFGWPAESSDAAAASVAGVVHSSILCPGLIIAFVSHRYSPSEHLSKAPLWWPELVDALLQFCTGYMIYDGTFIVMSRLDPSVSWIPAFVPDDYLFLGHHFMTSTYMTQARVYKAGHMSAMMCMLLGEASNPIMNTWFVTSEAIALDCCNGPIVQTAHVYIEMAFAAIYLLFRVVLGPILCLHMSYDLICSKNAKDHLPLSIRLFWNFMIWAVIVGSYSWIVFTYELLQKHLGETEQEL